MSLTERGKASPRQAWMLGDSCVSVQLGAHIDPVVNERCIALADAVERLGVYGVRDVVPTYNAVTVHFDPLVIDSARLAHELERLAASDLPSTVSATRTVEIPVVRRRSRSGFGSGCGVRRMLRGRCRAASRGTRISRLHARISSRLRLHGVGGSADRDAAPRCSAPAGRRRLGWHRRGTDRNLPLRDAWRLAHNRPDLDEGVRCSEDRTVSVEGWRLRDVRARVTDG